MASGVSSTLKPPEAWSHARVCLMLAVSCLSSDSDVQRYGGMVLLNLVRDAYGQVDELIDVVVPVFDLSNGEIPAFLVEQVGIDALLQKIESRKKAETSSDMLTRLNGLAYQAHVYQNRTTR
jgi:hypothetical protein